MKETTPERTIAELKNEYSAKAVGLMNARSARVAELASLRTPTGDPYYMDRLDHAQKHQVLLEQKAELAEEDRRRLRQEFEQAHDAYSKAVAERTSVLRERLFAVEGGEKADLLARLATASEDELRQMLDIAGETSNRDLSRAVFATAHRRDIPELLVRYFAEIDAGAQSLYAEYNDVPSEETVERQRSDIERMIPPASAETLAGTPQVNR